MRGLSRPESRGPSIVGAHFHVLALQVLPDLVPLALETQGFAEVVVGHGVIFLDSESLAELGDRLIRLALRSQSDAEVVVGHGVILLDSEGLTILGDGLIQLALVAQGVTKVIVGLGVIFLESNGRAILGAVDQREGTTVLANRLDSFQLQYFDSTGTQLDVATTPSAVITAWKVRITVGVILPAEGQPGSPGYQPQSTINLVSDVVLRNASQITF